MPSSLRFVVALLGLAALSAPISFAVIHGQDTRAARLRAEAMTGGQAARGKLAIRRFGCNACHEIRIAGESSGMVGPPLAGVASRAELAGQLPNTPENLIAWIRFPQRLRPGCGMPQQPISEPDARDIAAYLLTLRKG